MQDKGAAIGLKARPMSIERLRSVKFLSNTRLNIASNNVFRECRSGHRQWRSAIHYQPLTCCLLVRLIRKIACHALLKDKGDFKLAKQPRGEK